MTQSHFVSLGATRLLVADDDPILREFAIANLSTPDVEVEVSEDGLVAWQRLQKPGIDIALIDLDMPRLNGFELIERIRWDENLKHLPIVVVTGREDMIAVDRAFSLGATSFVVKPLNWRLLLHQLAYVLKSSRAESEVRNALRALEAAADMKDRVLRLSRQKIAKPIQLIMQNAQLFADTDLDATLKRAMRDILQASLDVGDVYNDLVEVEKAMRIDH